jgi:hypothetical protein
MGSHIEDGADYSHRIRLGVLLNLDQEQEQWDWLHGQLASRLPDKKLSFAELYSAYEEESGTCIGCD